MIKATLASISVALIISACSSAPIETGSEETTGTAEQNLTPTASVVLTNGNVLEVYELTPGDVFYSETGQRGTPKTDLAKFRGKSVRQTLEALPLSSAIPNTVDELDKRRVAFKASSAAKVREERPSGEKNSSEIPAASESISKLSTTQFKNTFCNVDETEVSGDCTGYGRNCWPNSTNDYTFARNDINDGFMAVDSFSGTAVTMKMQYRPGYGWTTMGQWDVPLGTWRWAQHTSSCPEETSLACGCADWDWQAKVFNATGDGYNLNIQYSERDDGFWD